MEHKIGDYSFMECGICSVKPGTPTYCRSCLHNRDMLVAAVKAIEVAKVEIPQSIHAEALQGRWTLCGLNVNTLIDHTTGNVDSVTCPKCQEKLVHVTNDDNFCNHANPNCNCDIDDDEEDYEEMSVRELRQLCRNRSIDTSLDGIPISRCKKGKLIVVLECWDDMPEEDKRKEILMNLSLSERVARLEEQVAELIENKEGQ